MTHLTATRVKIITVEICFSEILFCICYILGKIGHIIVNSRQIEFWGEFNIILKTEVFHSIRQHLTPTSEIVR